MQRTLPALASTVIRSVFFGISLGCMAALFLAVFHGPLVEAIQYQQYSLAMEVIRSQVTRQAGFFSAFAIAVLLLRFVIHRLLQLALNVTANLAAPRRIGTALLQPHAATSLATGLLAFTVIGYYLHTNVFLPVLLTPKGLIAHLSLLLGALLLGLVLIVLRRPLERLWGALSGNRSAVLALAFIAALNAPILFSSAPESLAREAGGTRLYVVALDALDWTVLKPMIEADKLPSFRRLMESGTYARLGTIRPAFSPIIWNTVATGKSVNKHGIHGFVIKRDGSQIPVTSNMRKAEPIWKILSRYDRRVAVLGWWTTWPAEQVNGYIASSYVSLAGGPIKGAIVDDENIPGQTYPEELFDEVVPVIRKVREQEAERTERIFGKLDMDSLSEAEKSNLEDVRWVLFADGIYENLTWHMLEKEQFDFFAVYLAGVDVLGHRFWKYYEPDAYDYGLSADEIKRFSGAIPNYYQYVDDFLGRLLDRMDARDSIVVLSDHGMHGIPPEPEDKFMAERSGDHAIGTDAVLFLSGPPFRKGYELGESAGITPRQSVFDITPTILYTMGFPVARDMDGRVLLEAFGDDFKDVHKVSYINTYEVGNGTGGGEAIQSDTDEELLERLRGLGYIQ